MRSFKISVVKALVVVFAMLMLGTTTFAQVSVTFPTVSGVTGDMKTGDITVSNLPANTNAFSFQFNYDPSVVYVTHDDADDASTMIGSNHPTVNANTATGLISVAWANATPLTGTSGTLLKLRFQFRNAGTTALNPGTTFIFNVTPVSIANITPGSATTPSIGVTIGSYTVTTPSEFFYIPVTTTSLGTNNIFSYDFTATFDKTKITILDYATSPAGKTASLIDGKSAPQINVNNTTGNVSFAWANATPLTGNGGVLVYLKAKAVVKGTSTVALTSFNYNNGTPVAARYDGTILVNNSKPVFGTSTTGYSVNENVALPINFAATDADGDVLTYSFTSSSTKIPSSTFSTSTGAFNWTPGYTDAGTYTITVGVTDGTDAAAPLVVTITVNDINRTPTLTLNPNQTSFTVAETTPLNIQLVGGDSDTDNTLKYSFTSTATIIPSSALNTSTGAFSWTPTAAQSGTYVVVFKVEDYKGTTALGTSATKTATIFVSNTNQAPVFTSVPSTPPAIPVHKAPNPVYYNFQYVATDVDGQTLTYSLIAGPTGASITTAGMFSWAPTVEQAGKTYVVTVQVTDGVVAVTSTVNLTTSSTITGVEETPAVPTEFSLNQNYPNPFNPTTTITFGLPSESNVRLSIFNIIGQEVAVVVNNTMAAGFHKVNFDASKLTSGMYLYRIQAGDFVQIRKMLLMK